MLAACDGVFDVMSNSDVGDMALNGVKSLLQSRSVFSSEGGDETRVAAICQKVGKGMAPQLPPADRSDRRGGWLEAQLPRRHYGWVVRCRPPRRSPNRRLLRADEQR